MFVMAGLVGCWWLATDVLIPDWRLAREADRYMKTTCQVVDARVVSVPGLAEQEYCPELLVEYEMSPGNLRQAWTRHGVGRDVPSEREARAVLDKHQLGDQLTCWFDPQQPQLVTLDLEQRYLPWLVLCIPVSLIIAGAIGVARALVGGQASPERMSDLVLSGTGLKLLGKAPREMLASGLPSLEGVNDSPGVRLAYRLPMYGAEGWRVFGMATLCLLWNTLAAVFIYQLFVARLSSLGWRLAAVLLLIVTLAAIGGWLVYRLWRDSQSVSGAGVTQAEVSKHPLFAGDSCQAVLFQSGNLRARTLTISLVCEEIATYRQGTDTRTTTVESYRTVLHSERFVKAAPGEPYAVRIRGSDSGRCTSFLHIAAQRDTLGVGGLGFVASLVGNQASIPPVCLSSLMASRTSER